MIFYCLESATWGGIVCFFTSKEWFLSVLTWVVFFEVALSEAANKTLLSENKLTCFKTPLQLQSQGSASLKNSSHFVLEVLGGKHSAGLAEQWLGWSSWLWCRRVWIPPEQQSQGATVVTGRAQQPGICYAWLQGCCEDLINTWKAFWGPQMTRFTELQMTVIISPLCLWWQIASKKKPSTKTRHFSQNLCYSRLLLEKKVDLYPI